MNRFPLNLAASTALPTTPVVVVKPPEKSEEAFVAVTFNPIELPTTWEPVGVDDAPKQIDAKLCKSRRRFHTLVECLTFIREHNEPLWNKFADTARLPDQWAMVAWSGSGSRPLREAYTRLVTPLEYFQSVIFPSRTWKPSGLLDVPVGFWNEESFRDGMERFTTADEAVVAAVESNRKWPRRTCAFGPTWRVVLAVEHGPLVDQDVFDFSGATGIYQPQDGPRAPFLAVAGAWTLRDVVDCAIAHRERECKAFLERGAAS